MWINGCFETVCQIGKEEKKKEETRSIAAFSKCRLALWCSGQASRPLEPRTAVQIRPGLLFAFSMASLSFFKFSGCKCCVE